MDENPTNAKEQCELGKKYRWGNGLQQDQKKALYWFNKASEQGNAEASFLVAVYYDHGWGGVPEDKKMAKHYEARSVEQFTKAAEQGDADAQQSLGSAYGSPSFGGVSKDKKKEAYWYAKAFEQFTKAAENGDADAQYKLGVLHITYYNSLQGIQNDDKKVVYWFTKAAERGNADGQYGLGGCYHYGIRGVRENEEKAIYWYTKAAEQSHANAQDSLGRIYSDNKNMEKANYWYTKAAEGGNSHAKYQLGINYSNGVGVPKDLEKAKYWIALAAEPEVGSSDTEKNVLKKLIETLEAEELETWKQKHPKEWDETKKKLAKKNKILFPLGSIIGGIWFAFIDIALANPSAYGGYWSTIGIHVLLSGILVFILGWIGNGPTEGFKLGCGLLIIGSIPVALLGLLVSVIPIGWSIAIGVGVGLILSSAVSATSEDSMLKLARANKSLVAEQTMNVQE
jgi:TPR repeat protein